MSRLQKKCFLGATSLHGLLLLALLIGPGFIKQPKVDNTPMIEILPMVATDDKQAGGGAPRPAPAVQQQPITQPQPAPPPPQRTETVQRPQPTPPRTEPAKTEPPKVVRNDAEPVEKKPTNVKPAHQVQVSQRVVSLANNRPTPTRTTTSTATTAANNAAQQAISRTQERLRAGLSSSTRVEMPEGVGGGGVSYADYGQIVRRVYTDAWLVPDDMTDDEATIKVSVTVARDGKVLAARITQPSGSSAANRSIQNTLDRIRDIGYPFPQGAKESQRTFIMTFNLKAKKAFG
jgi:periplasmic protein TonB